MQMLKVLFWVVAGLFMTLTESSTKFSALAASPAPTVPITVVNYSKLPVYATAVALDETELCGKLHLSPSSPLRMRRADTSEEIPLARVTEAGRPLLRLYLSLPPLSRLDLLAEPAALWHESQPSRASCDPASVTGTLTNGILGVTFDRKGWNLGFAPASQAGQNQSAPVKKLLVENGQLDFWIDNQNRGRLMNSNPADLGLIHYATQSRLEKCESSIGPEGRPAFRIVRRLEGLAQAMTVTETFELLPGLPVMTCRVQWRNDGDAPLWVAYVSSGDGIKGKWSKSLMPTPLIERKKTATEGDLNGSETRPSWLPQFCRISMESPATGCGFGMSTLLPTPKQVGTGSMVWGRGCGLYSLDGQTLMFSPKEAERNPDGVWHSAIWDTTGKTTACFKETVAPLIRGVVRHGLIPSKEQVLARVKLAVYNDMKGAGDLKAWPHYVEYGPLYAATYGFRKMGNIDGQLWEFFPNTGRYYFIPVLVQGNEPLGGGIRNIPVSQLQDVASVKRIFDAAYPAWYEGDALVTRVGETLTIQNSHENEDLTESYRVPLEGQTVKSIAGKMNPNSYLVGKIEEQGKRFWFQVNTEYPERDTEVSLTCACKPEVRIEPAAALREQAWDGTTKSLKLRLTHQQGAVEVSVQ